MKDKIDKILQLTDELDSEMQRTQSLNYKEISKCRWALYEISIQADKIKKVIEK